MADERIDSIIGKQAFDEVERLETGLKGLVDTFIKSSNAAKLLEAALLKETTIKGVNNAIKEQKTQLSELEKYQKRIEDQVLKLAFAERELGKQMATNAVEIEQQNKANKNAARERLAASGSIDQLNAQLIKLRMAYDALSKAEREAAKGTDMLAHIQKLDTQLKQLDASTGRFQKNVGNYKNELFGLTQTLREMPAFAYSATTGIMGISNNLPILADNFKEVANATNESTGKVNGFGGALKIFGKSMFNFGNLFAIAIGLITIFSAQITMAATGAKKAKESVDDLTNSQDALNMALKSSEYKQAVENVNELRINIDLAKKGFLSKTDVVEQYNKTLGKSLGAVTNLDEAEMLLVKNGDAYIQMTLLKAAANLALDKAANEYLKAELKRQEEKQALDENTDVDGNYKPGALQSFKLLFSQGLGSDADNLHKQTNKEVTAIKKEGDKFKDIAAQFQKDASTISQAMGISFFGEGNNKTKTPKKTKAPKEKKTFERKGYGDVMSNLDMFADQQNSIGESAELMRKKMQDYIDNNPIQFKVEWTWQDDFDVFLEQLKSALEEAQDLTQQATDIMSNISDIIYANEMARIDMREKRQQEIYDAELKRINSSYTNQADKARELAKIEAVREAQQKRIDRDRISADRKRAQQQKAYDIANITTSTALAVIKAYTEGDPYTKVARAILAGAAGAVSLAKAVAAPIPQYAKGVKSKPTDGLALVGEAGTERVNLPDGTSFLTNGPTIMDLPKRTEVISNQELMAPLMALAYKKLGNGNVVTTDALGEALIESFEENTTEIKLLRKDIKESKTSVNIQGNFDHYIHVQNNIR